MRIAVPAETAANEARVAATPETVKKFVALGADVIVQSGAGVGSGLLDADYEKVGAKIAADVAATVKDADVVLAVRRPEPSALAGVRPGAAVIAIMDPYGQEKALKSLATAQVQAFAMELMPRI